MIYLSRIFGIILTLIFFSSTSCVRHSAHDPKIKAMFDFGDQADFRLRSARGQILQGQDRTGRLQISGWNVPAYQTFMFSVAVEDDASTSSLRDFEFAVLDENNQEICFPQLQKGRLVCSYHANAKSEVIWEEKIPYDHFKALAEPVYLIRKVKGLGGRRGSRTVVFKVNPWANSRKGLVAVEHMTFLTSEEEVKRLQSESYIPAGSFRVQKS